MDSRRKTSIIEITQGERYIAGDFIKKRRIQYYFSQAMRTCGIMWAIEWNQCDGS